MESSRVSGKGTQAKHGHVRSCEVEFQRVRLSLSHITMSAATSPNGSPAPIQPLHNPSQAAHIVVPQAPLGNVVNQAPGMGAKALLAKKLAKNMSAIFSFVPPILFLMSPLKSAILPSFHQQTTL